MADNSSPERKRRGIAPVDRPHRFDPRAYAWGCYFLRANAYEVKAMPDDNVDNPNAPPMPVGEEMKKPLPHIVARRWWYAMLIASVIPLLFLVVSWVAAAIYELGGWRTSVDHDDYSWISVTFGLTFHVGLPSSVVAILITSWWRLGLIYRSLLLLLCNIILFFGMFIMASCY